MKIRLKNNKYPHIIRQVCCKKTGDIVRISSTTLYYCLRCQKDWYVEPNGEVKSFADKT